MNDLNSIILEGEITSLFGNIDDNLCRCIINSNRSDGSCPIVIKMDGNLGKICNKTLKVGRKIRVVGSLVFNDPDHYINAKHIDFTILQKRGKNE